MFTSPLNTSKLEQMAKGMAPLEAQLLAKRQKLEERRRQLMERLSEVSQEGDVERTSFIAKELEQLDRLFSFVGSAHALLLGLMLRLETFRDLCLLLESLKLALRALHGVPKIVESLVEAQRALSEELGGELAELLMATNALVEQAFGRLTSLYAEARTQAEASGPEVLRGLAEELGRKMGELEQEWLELHLQNAQKELELA
ncbi:MAG: hypothetical protein C4339_02440 [Nitrososphaerota archaeon]|mgnify:CR=1 FL=1